MIRSDLDQADALLDAVDRQIAGDTIGAGLIAIPATEYQPVQATSILINWIVQAIAAVAQARGTTDLHAIRAELWTKPDRGAGEPS